MSCTLQPERSYPGIYSARLTPNAREKATDGAHERWAAEWAEWAAAGGAGTLPARAAGGPLSRGGWLAQRETPPHARSAARGASRAGRRRRHLVYLARTGQAHHRLDSGAR